MNERIKEMVFRCYNECGDYYIGSLSFFDHEKFAELIVKECADFLKDKMDDHFAAEQLEEHFGVEK